jgi:hypothetical protein
MQEKPDPLCGPGAAKFLGHGDQVVVMHPDEVTRPEQGREGVGE